MNSVQILGNLGRDPVIRATKTGRAMAAFSVAVSRTFTNPQGEQREFTDWISVVAWGNLAESVGNQLHKGSRVFVEGRFTTRSYDTPDGQRRWVSEVTANVIAIPLQGSRGGETSGGSFNGSYGGQSGGSGYSNGGYSNSGNGGYRNGGNAGGYGNAGGNPPPAPASAPQQDQQKGGNFGQFGPSQTDEEIPF